MPAAAKPLGVAGFFLATDEVNAALQAGELDRAVEVMTGASLLTETAHAVGDEMKRRGQQCEDRLAISRKAKQRQLDEIDKSIEACRKDRNQVRSGKR
jgi:predicted phage gp36 major capsid-like protein